MDAFKVKDQKPFTFFLVWWFKLILFPGIHEKGEVVSIENNSRENQSTPVQLYIEKTYHLEKESKF